METRIVQNVDSPLIGVDCNIMKSAVPPDTKPRLMGQALFML